MAVSQTVCTASSRTSQNGIIVAGCIGTLVVSNNQNRIAPLFNSEFQKTDSLPEIQFVELFPNPTSNFVTIPAEILQKNEKIVIQIFSQNGQLISEKYLFSSQSIIDFQYLPSGLYFILFMGSEDRFLGKIIKTPK
jgi:hypothetical protein